MASGDQANTGRKRKRDDPEQSARFIEKARELETDESGKAFDRAFKKIVPKKDKRKPS